MQDTLPAMEHALERWVQRRGGVVDGVTIASLGDGERGLVLARDVAAHTTLLSVPLASCGGSVRGAATPAGRAWLAACAASGATASPVALAAVWLCEERAKGASAFAPFLASLPGRDALGHLPLFWDNGALRTALRGSPCLGHVDAQRRSAARWYADLARCDGGWAARVSPRTFAWAVACVLSRTFRAPASAFGAAYGELAVDEPESVVLLVPLVDMLNHAAPADAPAAPCAWAVAGGAFSVATTGRATRGAEATIEYFSGRAPAHALLSYGFCGETSASAEVRLRVPFPRDRRGLVAGLERRDAHRSKRRRVVRCGLGVGDGAAAATALSLFRVASADAADLTRWRRRDAGADAATLARTPRSAANEARALEAFLDAVVAARGRYGPRPEAKDARAAFARVVRAGELKVLDHLELVARLAASMLEPLLDPATARDDDDDDDGPLTLDAYAALLENQLACDENLADNI